MKPPRAPSPVALQITCALSLSALATGCGSDFTPQSEITGLRFLAINASPPWLRPTETTTITPLVVGAEDPTQLRYRWRWCPLLGPNTTEFECLVTVEDLNQALGAEILPPDFFELGTSSTATLAYDLPPELIESVCLGLREQNELSNLINLPDCDGTFPISIRVDLEEDERTITAFKDIRLIYDPGRRPNQNPTISSLGIQILGRADPSQLINFDQQFLFELGRSPTVDALTQLDELSETFTATRTEATDDNMTVLVPFETREQLTFSWFAETGSYDVDRTGFLPDTVQSEDEPDGVPLAEAWFEARTNIWASPLPEEFQGGETTIYLVIRDGREGTSWTTQTLFIGDDSP